MIILWQTRFQQRKEVKILRRKLGLAQLMTIKKSSESVITVFRSDATTMIFHGRKIRIPHWKINIFTVGIQQNTRAIFFLFSKKNLIFFFFAVCHAEMNAILNKNSANIKGSKIYVVLFPCNECAKFIIQSGIKEVIYMSDKHHERLQTMAAKKMFAAAGITCRYLKNNYFFSSSSTTTLTSPSSPSSPSPSFGSIVPEIIPQTNNFTFSPISIGHFNPYNYYPIPAISPPSLNDYKTSKFEKTYACLFVCFVVVFDCYF